MVETDPVDVVGLTLGPMHAALAAARRMAPVELTGFHHVTEREPGIWFCCVPCSAAMVGAYLADVPPTLAAAHRIRELAGYRHPDPGTNGGTSLPRIAEGLAKAYGVELAPILAGDVAARLADGWAIMAGVNAGELAPVLRRWAPSFAGGHCVALAGTDGAGGWGWHDPLAPATTNGRPWTGEYARPADVAPALWATAYGARRLEPLMPIEADAALSSGRAITLATDTPCYADPRMVDRATVATGPVPLVGSAGKAWAVVVETRFGWADGQARPTVLYVPKAGHAPVIVPGAGGDAAQAAADMWDRWALGLGIPSRPEV